MSTRWMAVQYVGDTLRIPVANESDMDKPFGSSRLERDIKRIVVNPFSDSPQAFVPEAEKAKLRELVRIAGTYCVNGLCGKDDGCPLYLGKPYCAFPDCMRELGVEVDG